MPFYYASDHSKSVRTVHTFQQTDRSPCSHGLKPSLSRTACRKSTPIELSNNSLQRRLVVVNNMTCTRFSNTDCISSRGRILQVSNNHQEKLLIFMMKSVDVTSVNKGPRSVLSLAGCVEYRNRILGFRCSALSTSAVGKSDVLSY